MLKYNILLKKSKKKSKLQSFIKNYHPCQNWVQKNTALIQPNQTRIEYNKKCKKPTQTKVFNYIGCTLCN